jgi:hypothetical protein
LTRGIGLLNVFDAHHFKEIAKEGYQYEINHAFFPLFPYILNKLNAITGIEIGIIGTLYQLFVGYLNVLLLYK